MVFHQEQIPFLLGLVIIVILAIYSFRRSHMHMATTFGWLMVCVGFWIAAYTLDIANTDYHVKLFWLKVKYIGATASPVLWLVLAMVFTGNERWLTKTFYGVMGGWSLVVVTLAFTNEWHHLFWLDYRVDPNQIESVTVHGPLFALFAIVGAGVIPVSIAIYSVHLVKVQRFYRNRAILFIIAGALPVLGNVAHAHGYTLLANVDQVPLMLVIGCCFYAIAIFRYQALDVLKVAQNLVIDNVKAGVIVVDHTRKILGFNPYAADIFSQARVNTDLTELIPETNKLDLRDDQEFEIELNTDDRQCFLVKVSEIENPRVGKLGHALVMLDITERIAAEKALHQSMEARARFFANMSHELRTPLHGISGLMELLKRSISDPKQLDYVQKADASAQLLLSLINDVLDLSRIESGKLEFEAVPFDPSVVLNNVGSVLSLQAEEKSLQFTVSYLRPDQTATAHAVLGDPFRLTQVLNNLASNAVKFTSEGSVDLSAQTLRSDEGVTKIQFAVTDTGSGIDVEKQALLFEPFTQADTSTTRTHGGTGLGLSIAQQLVHSMGSEISVSSEPGRGSTFSFILEFPTSNISVANESTLVALPKDLAGVKALVVDDASVNRQVAQELLEQVGVNVTLAANGNEAIEIMRTHSFDIVLMDIHMPVMDGYAAARHIRQDRHLGNPPIVAMTASTYDEDRSMARDAGMDDLVVKPFQSHELYAVVRRWVASITTALEPDVVLVQNRDVQDSPNLLLSLHDEAIEKLAVLADTPEAWRDYAHYIKGAAGFLGAKELLDLSKELESQEKLDYQYARLRFEHAISKLKAVPDVVTPN